MRYRLVTSSTVSLSVLAVVCGITVPAHTVDSSATIQEVLVGHPTRETTMLDTGPDTMTAAVGAGTPKTWSTVELLRDRQARVPNSRNVTTSRAPLSGHSAPVSGPTIPLGHTAPARPNPSKIAIKPRISPPKDKPSAAPSPASVAVTTALAQRGKPYVWGATGPNSFDCSGLIQYAYRRAGIRLPRVTWDQMKSGRRVSVSAIRAGDLVFYRSAAHVGMYVGNGRMVHAPKPGTHVRTAGLYLMPVYAVVRPS